MATATSDTAKLAQVNMRRFGVEVETRDGGISVLRCTEPLGPMERNLVTLLRMRADAHPDRDFFCQRDAAGAWRCVTYADVRRAADAIGQALLDNGHGPDRPLAILSDNSIEQALVTFGAMTVGVPVMPVSPAYSLMSGDFAKLRQILELVGPGLVFVEDGAAYALLGPSGCGKTTLLNLISGLLHPTEGTILFDGLDVTDATPEARNIAQVFQFPVIYDTMTVYDNLAFPLRNRGVTAPDIERRVHEIAEMLELG